MFNDILNEILTQVKQKIGQKELPFNNDSPSRR